MIFKNNKTKTRQLTVYMMNQKSCICTTAWSKIEMLSSGYLIITYENEVSGLPAHIISSWNLIESQQ